MSFNRYHPLLQQFATPLSALLVHPQAPKMTLASLNKRERPASSSNLLALSEPQRKHREVQGREDGGFAAPLLSPRAGEQM